MRKMILTALLVTACGKGASAPSVPAAPTPDCKPPAIIDLSPLPRDLPLQRWGKVTQIAARRGFMSATAVSSSSIGRLVPELRQAVQDAGYTVGYTDNEGFEAEIFFDRGETLGVFRLRLGPCEGQVSVHLLYGSQNPPPQTGER